jgi:hypothetical protein
MKVLLRKVCYGIIGVEVLLVLYLGIMAYFVRSYDRSSGRIFDGLGRLLEPAPFVARFIFGADSYWAGWLQFGLEMVVFWGGAAIGVGLISYASMKKIDIKNKRRVCNGWCCGIRFLHPPAIHGTHFRISGFQGR